MLLRRWTLVLPLLLAAADTPEELYRSGVQLFEQGKLDAAAASLEQAVTSKPDHAGAWKALGVVYAAKGDHPVAEAAFRKACALAPSLADACFYHGRVLHLLNRFDDALGVLRRIVKDDRRAHRVMALSLEALGHWPEAESEFRTAMRLHRAGSEDARVDYGVALVRQGRPSDAIGPLEAGLAAAPNSARTHLELGRALIQLSRLEAALPHLQRAVAIDSNYSAAHLLLGRLYLRLGKREQAEPHLRQGATLAK